MTCMDDMWPLFQLRLQTPMLELRLPTDSDLADLASLAAAGVHDPEDQPFAVPWTDAAPADRARSTHPVSLVTARRLAAGQMVA